MGLFLRHSSKPTTMKNLKVMLLALAGLLVFASCSDNDDDAPKPMPNTPDIVEKAVATDNLSILVAALQAADLVDALKADGPFTVFAPTNEAFMALLNSNPQWNSLEDIDQELLKTVLLFHVVPGKVMAADLSDTYVSTLAMGAGNEAISLQVNTMGGVMFNANASPVTTDVMASNGVIHIIDAVMLPPTVVDLAVNNPAFSSLVAALTRADLTTDFVSILSGDGPFTVFAPTNAAFDALLASNNDWNTLADIPVATLEAVLTYHVIGGANVQSGALSDEQMVTTLGGDFTIDLDSGAQIKTTSGQTVNIVITDVQGINGVVHAVDQVLIP